MSCIKVLLEELKDEKLKRKRSEQCLEEQLKANTKLAREVVALKNELMGTRQLQNSMHEGESEADRNRHDKDSCAVENDLELIHGNME